MKEKINFNSMFGLKFRRTVHENIANDLMTEATMIEEGNAHLTWKELAEAQHELLWSSKRHLLRIAARNAAGPITQAAAEVARERQERFDVLDALAALDRRNSLMPTSPSRMRRGDLFKQDGEYYRVELVEERKDFDGGTGYAVWVSAARVPDCLTRDQLERDFVGVQWHTTITVLGDADVRRVVRRG